MKKTFALMMFGLIAVSSLTGCNTTEGVGEDLEEAGSEIQQNV